MERRNGDDDLQTGTPQQSEGAPGDAVTEAIEATLPESADEHQWYRAVFEFTRHLRGMPQFCDAEPADLRKEVRQWHDEASRRHPGRSFEETLGLFLKDWPQVTFPAGDDPLRLIFERAKAATTPAAAERYPDHRVRLLVTFCREMQRTVRDKPFFLACRSAGELLGVSQVTAWSWLSLLCRDKPPLLELVKQGTQNRAARYRYIGDRPATGVAEDAQPEPGTSSEPGQRADEGVLDRGSNAATHAVSASTDFQDLADVPFDEAGDQDDYSDVAAGW